MSYSSQEQLLQQHDSSVQSSHSRQLVVSVLYAAKKAKAKAKLGISG